MNNQDIAICVKDEAISWNRVHDVLWEAHSGNREKGIVMKSPSLSGEEIKNKLGKEGVMLLAMIKDQVIGTAGFIPKEINSWYYQGRYAYLCFDSILPEYEGKGIYKMICEERERLLKKEGLCGLYLDTHIKNIHMIRIKEKNGFKKVSLIDCGNHWNIVLFKWLDGCPYSPLFLKLKLFRSATISFLYRIKRSLFS